MTCRSRGRAPDIGFSADRGRGGGNPVTLGGRRWIPACAGMTGYVGMTLITALSLLALDVRAQDAPQPAPETPAAPGSDSSSQRDRSSRPSASTPTLNKETVTGGRLSDTDERRYSTASRMVFGREELDRYGDTTLGDVLKRLPGITISGTPGRGGDIRMRGLGSGYTLILLNGEPAPRGFSLDSLSPDQVERIEIMRAPIAENSARAIAGTINIILREELVKRENELRLSLGWEDGRGQPNLSLQRNDTIDKFSYNISANVAHREVPRETFTTTSAFDT